MTIQGVQIKDLKLLTDARGHLMEMLRADDSIFKGFGQCYITMCRKDAVKAWHYHNEQVDNFVCMMGKALVVLYDARKDSQTFGKVMEIMMEEPSDKSNPILLQIPPGVTHGFTPVDSEKAVILNIPDKPYDYKNPDEVRFPWNTEEVPYKWPDNVKIGG